MEPSGGDPNPDETPPQKGCSYEGCGGRHYAKGWCWTHYRRVRHHGSPELLALPFDPERQQAVLDCLRRGLTLEQAAAATGVSLRTINNCTDKGRKGHPRYQEFARQVDFNMRLNKRAKRRNHLSEAGREFLATLELETARSLRREPTRWAWKSMPQTRHHQGIPEPGHSRSA